MSKRKLATAAGVLVLARLALLGIELRQGLRRLATRPEPQDRLD